jgi:Cof subfamily protein (haloacid dehalogenase superfamily)
MVNKITEEILMMDQKPFKGWIALDIDGTITLDKYSIPQEVIDYLRECTQQGWRIAMATGSPVVCASLALSKFDFSYLFLPQNGSCAIEMPEKKCLFKRYIPKSALAEIELAMEGISGDFLIYSGYENQDRVYFRPKYFDADQKNYLKTYWERQKETSIPIENFSEIEQDTFPLIKCFGRIEEMSRLASRLRQSPRFNVALLRDPFTEDFHIMGITDRSASKGQSLEGAIAQMGAQKGILVAAGDDENDASMLQIADVAIAMAHAPEGLQKIAHLIAPPTKDMGILQALNIALKDR